MTAELVTYLTIILACMMLLPIPCPRYVTDRMLPNIAVDKKKPTRKILQFVSKNDRLAKLHPSWLKNEFTLYTYRQQNQVSKVDKNATQAYSQ